MGARDRAFLRAAPALQVLLGAVLPLVASAIARVTWDHHYLVTPAAWLLAAVTVAAALEGTRTATIAGAVSFTVYWWAFVPPEWSLRVDHVRDAQALAAFGVMVVGVVLAVDQAGRARHRATRYLAKLDALLANSPFAVGMIDADLAPLQSNDAMNDLLTLPEVRALASQVLRTRVAALDVEIVGTAPDGGPMHLMVGSFPVLGPGDELFGVGLVARDVRDAKALEAERATLLERVSRLQQVTASLAVARTTPDVVSVVVHDIRQLVGADAATLCVVDGDDLEMVGAGGFEDGALDRWRRFPADADTPFAEALRTGRLVVARTAAEVARRWSGIDPDRIAFPGVVAVPLLLDGRPVGAVSLTYSAERDFDDGDLAFLGAVGTQCSQALLRARLYEAERDARRLSEAAARRLSFLAESSAALASSLDWEETLRRVVDHAVPDLADLCAVFIVDEHGGIVPFTHRSIENDPAVTVTPSVREVIATGEPMFLPALEVGGVERGSGIAVPVLAQGMTIGAITLGVQRPRVLDESDLTLAIEWANRSGQAIANARLFREREHVARTLQASLLPPATPKVPGLELANRFFAVGAGIDVGGDFYDVIRLGRPGAPLDKWAIVIGDVRGKGAEAAAITGAARHSLRASALTESSPSEMLSRLNELLLVLDSDQDAQEPRFCTAVVVIVSPAEDEVALTLAVGGHPLPMVLRADGSVEQPGEPGTVLGILRTPTLVDHDLVLRPGDSIVLYTDGVTERHAGDRFFDEDGLAAVLSRCTGFTADALAERIETAARAFVEEAPRDDIAIVVARMPGRTATSTSVTTDLPHDATAPAHGRAFINTALRALGASEHVVETATLLTSELVTNAVNHGEGPVRIAVDCTDERVRVAVSDASNEPPLRVEVDDHAVGGRGLHLLESLASRWGVDAADVGKSVWFELVPG